MSQTSSIIYDRLLNAAGEISGKRILDIGCGRGVWACILRAENQKDDNNPAWIEGVETFKPYIDYAIEHGSIDHIIERDLEHSASLPYQNASFDIVICTEVIEHLSKEAGLKLLSEMERIAKEKIIISTPGVWIENSELDGNPHQKHMSLWHPSDFIERGYIVEGLGLGGFYFLPDSIRQKLCVVFSWLGKFWKSHCDTMFVTKVM